MPHADFSGLWRLDPAASIFHGPAPAGLLMKIDHRDSALTQQIIALDSAGAEKVQVFTCRIGEETLSVIGETTLRIQARWQDDESGELVIETVMSRQGRDLVFKDHWLQSADGKHLTMSHRDDALTGQTVILIRDDTEATAFRFDTLPTSP